jgi:DNA-binding winged helix-turn-helix (wHTH) protein/tetratricopeptide (TPR) repeat protein
MPENLFQFDDFVLDRGAYELRRDGEVVPLQRIPLELLILLLERHGQLVTREEILERVWGKGVFVDIENSINTAIRKVRRALNDDPAAPRFVTTVQARGYRFVAEIRAPKTSRAEQVRARPPSTMVGRERELVALLSGLDDAASRRGRLFLISGEPGVGKTRLADEVAAAADAKRMAILVGHCSEHDEAVAYLPFVEILENFVARAPNVATLRTALGEQAPELARLLPKLKSILPELPPPLDLPPPQARRHLFNCVFDFVARIASEQSTLMILEDLHWADDSTLSLLDHLTKRLSELPLLVIGTYRDAELNVTRPLAKTLEDLLRGRLATSIRLEGLPRDEVGAMLNSLSGKSPPAAVVAEIFAETEGNPFFVEELFRHLEEENRLYDLSGQFRSKLKIGELDAPPSVKLVVARRLARLNDLTQKMLATAAVIGRFFSFEILQASNGADAHSILEQVEEAEKAGLVFPVAESPRVRFMFSHELIRQAVLSSLSAVRRQRLHLEVADAIERIYSTTSESKYGESLDDHFAELAHHYLHSANTSQAVKYLHLAGQQALQRWANLEAINYLTKGLELLGSPPEVSERSRPADQAQRCSLLLLLGVGRLRVGEFASAHKAFLRAAETAKSFGSTENVIGAALELVHMTHTTGFPAPEAVPLLEEALQKLGPNDSPLKARTLGGLARCLGVTGEKQKLMIYAPQAVAMARRIGSPELVSYSLLGMFYALLGPEHAEERLAITTEMQDICTAADVQNLTYSQHFWRGYCLLELGDTAGADEDFDSYGRWAAESNQPFHQSICEMLRAMRALMGGRFEESERLAQNTFAIARSMQAETAAGVLGLQMFALRREQGRLKEVEPVVRMFVQQNSADAAWRPGLAMIYSELGLTADARAEFENLARNDFTDLPRDSLWMGTITFLVDICTFLGDRDRANTLYRILLPFAGRNVVVSNGVVCYGALSRYLGALATTLERWDDAARHFEDALAMNTRMDARPWLAHTQEQYATMLLARSQSRRDRNKAATLLSAAVATARELGMRALEERIAAGAVQMKPELH